MLSTKPNLVKLALLVLASLLTLAPASGQISTIASVASTVPKLSTLLEAVSKCTPILDAAQDPDTMVTLFAPTNTIRSTDATETIIDAPTLLTGQTVAISKVGDDVMVNDAKVVTPDVEIGSNSIVHIIDVVLLPPS
eukprot:gene29056-32259_t